MFWVLAEPIIVGCQKLFLFESLKFLTTININHIKMGLSSQHFCAMIYYDFRHVVNQNANSAWINLNPHLAMILILCQSETQVQRV